MYIEAHVKEEGPIQSVQFASEIKNIIFKLTENLNKKLKKKKRRKRKLKTLKNENTASVLH